MPDDADKREPIDYAAPVRRDRVLAIVALTSACVADLSYLARHFTLHLYKTRAIASVDFMDMAAVTGFGRISLVFGSAAIILAPLAWKQRKSGTLEILALFFSVLYWASHVF